MSHDVTGTLQGMLQGQRPANPRRCYDVTDVTDVTGLPACRRARVTRTPLKAILYSLAHVVTPCHVCNVCNKLIKTKGYKEKACNKACNVPVTSSQSLIIGGVL